MFFEIHGTRKMNLERGLYESAYILKYYKKEKELRKLSKKQLEKVIETLDKEIQFHNVKSSGFLTFFGLFLVVFFFIIPITTNTLGSGYYKIIGDKTYELESLELSMYGKEYESFPEGVRGTFKSFDGFDNIISTMNITIVFFMIISLYYLASLFRTRRLYKLLNLSRYICFLK